MIDRNLFTETKPSKLEIIADYALAVAIGICLTIGALAYFDILTY